MKKILLTLVATGSVAVLAFSGFAATSASAAAPVLGQSRVKITQLGTDAMGADSFRNRNAEFIEFKNVGAQQVNVKDWETADAWAYGDTSDSKCNMVKLTAANTDLTDGTGGELFLQPGEAVRVYTGFGPAAGETRGAFHNVFMNSGFAPRAGCGLNGQYWTNNADDAYLLNADGDVVAHVSYNHHGGYETSFPIS
jgi:hypothetical protein